MHEHAQCKDLDLQWSRERKLRDPSVGVGVQCSGSITAQRRKAVTQCTGTEPGCTDLTRTRHSTAGLVGAMTPVERCPSLVAMTQSCSEYGAPVSNLGVH